MESVYCVKGMAMDTVRLMGPLGGNLHSSVSWPRWNAILGALK